MSNSAENVPAVGPVDDKPQSAADKFLGLLDKPDQWIAGAANKGLELLQEIRMHIPGMVPLTPWERYYESKHGLDLKTRAGWQKVREEGVTQRDMLVRYIQDAGVPHEILMQMAETSPVANTRSALLSLDKEMAELINDWLNHLPTIALTATGASGLLMLASQGQEINLPMIIGALGVNAVYGRADMRAYAMFNNVRPNRIPLEFALLLLNFLQSHSRALANVDGIANPNAIAQQAFGGMSARIQEVEIWLRAIGAFSGVMGVQFTGVDSPQQLKKKAIEMAATLGVTALLVAFMGLSNISSW